MRNLLRQGMLDPGTLRRTLEQLPVEERDSYWDDVYHASGPRAFDFEDDDELPRGCCPYLPCSVDTILGSVRCARISHEDTFVDVGSGLGRAMTLVHFLTRASAVGIEVQGPLVREARRLAQFFDASRVSTRLGDAVQLMRSIPLGTVYFLYCPFSGNRLTAFTAELRAQTLGRTIRVCTVDLPPLGVPWLLPVETGNASLSVYESRT